MLATFKPTEFEEEFDKFLEAQCRAREAFNSKVASDESKRKDFSPSNNVMHLMATLFGSEKFEYWKRAKYYDGIRSYFCY